MPHGCRFIIWFWLCLCSLLTWCDGAPAGESYGDECVCYSGSSHCALFPNTQTCHVSMVPSDQVAPVPVGVYAAQIGHCNAMLYNPCTSADGDCSRRTCRLDLCYRMLHDPDAMGATVVTIWSGLLGSIAEIQDEKSALLGPHSEIAPNVEWHCGVERFGEALHPGPADGFLRCGTFNPAQLYNSEDIVNEFPDGIWTAAETSHTSSARSICHHRLRKAGWKVLWGPDVQPHHGAAGNLRGKASGVAIVSSLPVAPYGLEIPAEIMATCRFTDGLVQINPQVCMYISVMYGPQQNGTHQTGDGMFNSLFFLACARARTFQGPALITGDFNKNLEHNAAWNELQTYGWRDAAVLWEDMTGNVAPNTCRDTKRHSFMLINPPLIEAIRGNGVCAEYSFDSHPVLFSDFDLPCIVGSRSVWSLPRTTDEFLFDTDLLLEGALELLPKHEARFNTALECGDAHKAVAIFAETFDAVFDYGCVSVDGSKQKLPNACKGRCRKPFKKLVPASGHRVRPARDGEYNPAVCQTTVQIRQRVRQVRRLQSLERQLHAVDRNFNIAAVCQCEQLWRSICSAPGFSPGFPAWCLQTCGVFVPQDLPHKSFIHEIAEQLRCHCDELIRVNKRNQYQTRQSAIARDMLVGGANTCRTLKEEQTAPVAFFLSERTVDVARIRWSLDGRDMLITKGDLQHFDPTLPVVFHGQCAKVSKVVGNKVYLDRKVLCKKDFPLVLVQKVPIQHAPQMHEMTVEQWSTLWSREPHDDQLSCWDEVLKLIDEMPAIESATFQPIDQERWAHSLKNLRNRSARGADGFSARDLKLCPAPLNKWLFKIYEQFEDGKAWPKQLASARVVMLPKPGNDTVSPMHMRPITIMGRLYRQWSRIRASETMKQLVLHGDPSALGAAAGISADQMAARILDAVEDAVETRGSCVGLVVDLVKAFNAVPRLPLYALLLKFGVPAQYVQGLWSMMTCLQRYVDLAGQLSEPCGSTTGVPEGCAYSVCSMLAITLCAAHVVPGEDGLHTAFYADNWGMFANSPEMLLDAIQKLQKFTCLLKMQIAPGKSWTWGSNAKVRSFLRQHSPFPVVNLTHDLGCDVSYVQKPVKKVTRTRWQKSIRTLQRIARRQISKRFKIKLANMLGWSKAAYGSEFVTHTRHEWRSLRTALCKAIGRSHCGANPFLACAIAHDVIDPQLADVLRKLKFWRRFFRHFSDRRAAFLQRLSKAEPIAKVGPAVALKHALTQIGWQCDHDGWIRHHTGVQLQWTTCSKSHLTAMVTLCWSSYVCEIASARKHFTLQSFDSRSYERILAEFSPVHRGVCLSLLDGKHVTNDILRKFHKVITEDKCLLCGQRDGKIHRWFECPNLSDVRKEHRGLLRWLQRQDETVQHFCLWNFDFRPVVAKCLIPWNVQFILPDDDSDWYEIYTDGSARYNDVLHYTIGGGAAILYDADKWKLLQACILPGGDHTPFRAEIWAVFLALQNKRKVQIYCDCQAVVQVVQYLLQCRKFGTYPRFHDHDDLWNLVWKHVLLRRPGEIVIQKIKAHTKWRQIEDAELRRHGRYSEVVDRQAKRVVQTFIDNAAVNFQRIYSSMLADTAKIQEMLQVWCKIADLVFAQRKPVSRGYGDMPLFPCPSGVVIWRGTDGPTECNDGSPFPSKFLRRILLWLQQLVWYQGGETSLLELYADFSWWTRSLAPVRVSDLQGHYRKPKDGICYVLRDESIAADSLPNMLKKQTRVFNDCVRWLARLQPSPIPFDIVDKVSSSGRVGYTVAVPGFQCSVAFATHDLALQKLWQYFHPQTGTFRNLASPWNVPPCHAASCAGA